MKCNEGEMFKIGIGEEIARSNGSVTLQGGEVSGGQC